MKSLVFRLVTIVTCSLLASAWQLPAWAARPLSDFNPYRELRWGMPEYEPYGAAQDIQGLRSVVGRVVTYRYSSTGFIPTSSPQQATQGDFVITLLWFGQNEGCVLEVVVQYLPVDPTTRRAGLAPLKVVLAPNLEISKPAGNITDEVFYEIPSNGVINRPGKYLIARSAFALDSRQIQRLIQSSQGDVRMRVVLKNGQTADVPIDRNTATQWSSVYSYNPTCGRRPAPAEPPPNRNPRRTLPPLNDVPEDHWARAYVDTLHFHNIVRGRETGQFSPNERITRSQFAAIVVKAFDPKHVRNAPPFPDIVPSRLLPPGARKLSEAELRQAEELRRQEERAIVLAVRGGFMTGYPDGMNRYVFRPDQPITKAEAITALISGLQQQYPGKFPSADSALLGQYYQDAAAIKFPTQREAIAKATQLGMVVNHPNLRQLQPNKPATRAEVVALVYQALVAIEKAERIPSPYLVRIAN